MRINAPIVQLALDYPTIDEALRMAEIGVKAGVDWLEAGTPLIVSQGVNTIGQLKRAFPEFPVLADYKTMDSGGRNVNITKQQGAQVMTVCANATDETVKAAIAAGKETGVWVVTDTIGCKDPAARAGLCAEWGVNMIYLHYAADQWRSDPNNNPTPRWAKQTLESVTIPVGVGTFGAKDAVESVKLGVELVAIGHPLISGSDPLSALKDYIQQVKSAYRKRSS